MNILSVCSYGKARSVICQSLVGGQILPGGINQCSHLIIRENCRWADKIIVMTEIHYMFFKKLYPEFLPKIVTLGVNDLYGCFKESPILREMLREKLQRNLIPLLSDDHKIINS